MTASAQPMRDHHDENPHRHQDRLICNMKCKASIRFILTNTRYTAGALKPLVPLMSEDLEGLACAASSICRSIIVEDEKHKQEFVAAGGVKGFV